VIAPAPVDYGRRVPERAEAHRPESEDASVAVAPPVSLALSAPGAVLALQRSAGNRAVAALSRRHAALARDTDTWSKDYKTRKTRQNLTLDEYKAAIGTAGAEKYAPAIKGAGAWAAPRSPPSRSAARSSVRSSCRRSRATRRSRLEEAANPK
jgi:hypothetical protein